MEGRVLSIVHVWVGDVLTLVVRVPPLEDEPKGDWLQGPG